MVTSSKCWEGARWSFREGMEKDGASSPFTKTAAYRVGGRGERGGGPTALKKKKGVGFGLGKRKGK